jgi:uncharacterized repeat protein (TIGR03803 family)
MENPVTEHSMTDPYNRLRVFRPQSARTLLWLACFASTVGVAPAQWTEVVLHRFYGANDGRNPNAGLIRDSAGNLYGTTCCGTSPGSVYKIDNSRHETVLYSFKDGADGAFPLGGVIRDSAGNLYGTTYKGGATYAGVVYKVDSSGNETVLHSFKYGADGGNPYAGVIRDPAGNLYGTTYYGGVWGAGVVYKVDSSGNETVLYSFTGGADGGNPYAGVIRDPAGNLYGTATRGGGSNVGVVYKVDSSGNETVLYSFVGGLDGAIPVGGVIRDSAGSLYGSTANGGNWGYGNVYKLDSAGNETVLYSFTGGADGESPFAGVIRDSAGNFYGTTFEGGASNKGVVYKVDSSGNETVLYSFTGPDGAKPTAGLIFDKAGNLYGTTQYGGRERAGVVFKVKP